MEARKIAGNKRVKGTLSARQRRPHNIILVCCWRSGPLPKSSVCISSRQGLLSPGLSKASFPHKERYGYNNLPTNDLQSPSHCKLPRNYRQMIKGKPVFLESWFIKQGLITNGPRMVGGRETCGVSSCETAFIYYSANWGHPQLQI